MEITRNNTKTKLTETEKLKNISRASNHKYTSVVLQSNTIMSINMETNKEDRNIPNIWVSKEGSTITRGGERPRKIIGEIVKKNLDFNDLATDID